MNIFNKMMIFGLLIAGCANGMGMPSTLNAEVQESAQIHEKEIAGKKEQDALKSIVIINEYPKGNPRNRHAYSLVAETDSGEYLGFLNCEEGRCDNAEEERPLCIVGLLAEVQRKKIGSRLMCAISYFFPSYQEITLDSVPEAVKFYEILGLKEQGWLSFSWSAKQWHEQQEAFVFEKLNDNKVRVTLKH